MIYYDYLIYIFWDFIFFYGNGVWCFVVLGNGLFDFGGLVFLFLFGFIFGL